LEGGGRGAFENFPWGFPDARRAAPKSLKLILVVLVEELENRTSPQENGRLSVENRRVVFPLDGIPALNWIKERHESCRESLKHTRLASERRAFCKQFSTKVTQAYELVNCYRPYGTVSDLREPLRHLAEALETLTRIKDYDDLHPIQHTELPPYLLVKYDRPPEAIWLHIKLGYTQRCLLLTIRLLWLVLPDQAEMWSEWEKNLRNMDQWPHQFVIDSPDSQSRTVPAHPTLENVLKAAN
jgi:hypothetical protein